MLSEDIKTKTFKSKFNGFDKDEVQSYLKEIAEQMDQMDASNQYVQQQLYDANQVIDEFREKEATLNRSIVVAQQAADRLKAEAINEANNIVAQAQKQGQQILKASADQATRIKQETESLKDVSRTYIHQMKALVESAKATLEDERWEKLFQDQPVDPVDTPALDSVLRGDALPIKEGNAENIYQKHFETQDKAKKQEQMFEDNEQRYQVRLSKQPISDRTSSETQTTSTEKTSETNVEVESSSTETDLATAPDTSEAPLADETVTNPHTPDPDEAISFGADEPDSTESETPKAPTHTVLSAAGEEDNSSSDE